jgi:fructose-specific component phosphotransferase system IIB-like protein
MPKAPKTPKTPKSAKAPKSEAAAPAGSELVYLEGVAAPYAIPAAYLADAKACAAEYKVELEAADSRPVVSRSRPR